MSRASELNSFREVISAMACTRVVALFADVGFCAVLAISVVYSFTELFLEFNWWHACSFCDEE